MVATMYEQFKQQQLQKQYLALCMSTPAENLTVDAGIADHPSLKCSPRPSHTSVLSVSYSYIGGTGKSSLLCKPWFSLDRMTTFAQPCDGIHAVMLHALPPLFLGTILCLVQTLKKHSPTAS